MTPVSTGLLDPDHPRGDVDKSDTRSLARAPVIQIDAVEEVLARQEEHLLPDVARPVRDRVARDEEGPWREFHRVDDSGIPSRGMLDGATHAPPANPFLTLWQQG